MSITLVLSYYNQPYDLLQKHVNHWNEFENKELFDFIIVDDCSKKMKLVHLIDYIQSKANIRYFEIEDDIKWNLAGSRNLGVSQSKTEWIMLCDMDTIVDKECAKEMIKATKMADNEKYLFRFNRIVPEDPGHEKNNKMHPGLRMLRRQDYLDVNGCDEDLVGNYGYYTLSLEEHLMAAKGFRLYDLMDAYILYYPEGDCDYLEKSNKKNKKKVHHKIETGEWSTDMIRFKWHEILM